LCSVDVGEPGSIQFGVNRPQGGIQPFLIRGIGGVADADHLPIRREQSAAAAAFDRQPGDLDVRRSEELIERSDFALPRARLTAVVAADAGDGVAAGDPVSIGRDAGHGDGAGRANADQPHITFEVVGNQAPGDGLGGTRAEQIHGDSSFAR